MVFCSLHFLPIFLLGRRTQGLTHRPQSPEPPIMVKEPDVMREPLKALSLRPSLLSSASCRRSAEPPIMVKDPDVIREPLKALSLRRFWWCSDSWRAVSSAAGGVSGLVSRRRPPASGGVSDTG